MEVEDDAENDENSTDDAADMVALEPIAGDSDKKARDGESHRTTTNNIIAVVVLIEELSTVKEVDIDDALLLALLF